jgi:hypothetical protein
MRIKEAIDQISFAADGDYITSYDLYPFEVAIHALEKQLPKTVNRKKLDAFTDLYSCPACSARFLQRRRYCDKCGQALEWED